MKDLESYKDPQSLRNPSVVFGCAKCKSEIPKSTLFCKKCGIKYRSFDEE